MIFDLRKLAGRVDNRACSMLISTNEKNVAGFRAERSTTEETQRAFGAVRAEGLELRSKKILAHRKSKVAIAILFFSSSFLQRCPTQPALNRPARKFGCSPVLFTAYRAEMPLFRLRERRRPLLWRGRSPDQVFILLSGIGQMAWGYYIKGGLSPLRC